MRKGAKKVNIIWKGLSVACISVVYVSDDGSFQGKDRHVLFKGTLAYSELYVFNINRSQNLASCKGYGKNNKLVKDK